MKKRCYSNLLSFVADSRLAQPSSSRGALVFTNIIVQSIGNFLRSLRNFFNRRLEEIARELLSKLCFRRAVSDVPHHKRVIFDAWKISSFVRSRCCRSSRGAAEYDEFTFYERELYLQKFHQTTCRRESLVVSNVKDLFFLGFGSLGFSFFFLSLKRRLLALFFSVAFEREQRRERERERGFHNRERCFLFLSFLLWRRKRSFFLPRRAEHSFQRIHSLIRVSPGG